MLLDWNRVRFHFQVSAIVVHDIFELSLSRKLVEVGVDPIELVF